MSAIMTAGRRVVLPSSPFIPSEFFLQQGWRSLDRDPRSLEVGELDLARVRFVNTLRPGETGIHGQVRVDRLRKSPLICPDGRLAVILRTDYLSHPTEKTILHRFLTECGVTEFCVDGEVLERPMGDRAKCTLWFFHQGRNGWRWGARPLHWIGDVPSLVFDDGAPEEDR